MPSYNAKLLTGATVLHTVFCSCVSFRRNQIIGYCAGVLLLLLLVILLLLLLLLGIIVC